jgi:DNA-directed RNA polymerase specialized sigma24 family protein
MHKQWVLTQDAFDTLLAWLDPDRERAGQKYEDIRLRLIKIFTCRGCWDAEELADETINRVSTKVGDVAFQYQGDPAIYFYGVSQKILLEYARKVKPAEISDNATAQQPAESPIEDDEPEYRCLDRCLENLPANNRRLVIEYYQLEKHAKIEHRKRLASEFGIALNALRIRAHRVRRALQDCVNHCLEQQPAN